MVKLNNTNINHPTVIDVDIDIDTCYILSTWFFNKYICLKYLFFYLDKKYLFLSLSRKSSKNNVLSLLRYFKNDFYRCTYWLLHYKYL